MNATSVKGVWSQEINEHLSVIVDTNRNQIIKKKDGVPTVHQYPSEPTVLMIDIMIKTIEAGEAINDAYQSALFKLNARKNQS